MKRYGFTSDDACHAGCRLEEFEDGEWVKYEDAKHLVEQPKCICAGRFEAIVTAKVQTPEPMTWICPAHGFKMFRMW